MYRVFNVLGVMAVGERLAATRSRYPLHDEHQR